VIAPIRETEGSGLASRMHRARRLVASTLLRRRSYPADDAPPVPHWKAWTFTVWTAVAAGAYFAHMIGWL
jgi:hypothetical protein